MNTLVLYASKHGATEAIAKEIALHLDNAQVSQLGKGATPDLGLFDSVIIGSSLYAGSIRKEAKSFIKEHSSELYSKKLGFFLSGLNQPQAQQAFEANFPKDALSAAVSTAFLGGIFDPGKCGMLERAIMKAASKQSSYTNTISSEKIEAFAKEFII
ncbi:MAG: flavodoxin domain-containing protein [Eubacteriaceae bacterium]|nr:flavodoxin domain-containing protein [Eubacteriaceae bacterium]